MENRELVMGVPNDLCIALGGCNDPESGLRGRIAFSRTAHNGGPQCFSGSFTGADLRIIIRAGEKSANGKNKPG